MNEFKLVPLEPTEAMIDAARDHHEGEPYLPVSLYKAMLAAAPAVQGEPVATIHVDGSFVHVSWRIPAPSRCAMDVYTAPQPAEQQPDDDAVDRFAAAMKAKLNKKRQEGRGGWQSMTAEQLSALLHEHVHKGDPLDVANLAMMLHQNGQRIEQQPAPDVEGLVEALERIAAWPDGGNQCGQANIKIFAAEALAAYRKGGEA